MTPTSKEASKFQKVRRVSVYGGDWSISASDPDGRPGDSYVCSIDYDALLKSHTALRIALEAFMEDTRFRVAIGGNPNAVKKMIAQARAALSLARTPEGPPVDDPPPLRLPARTD